MAFHIKISWILPPRIFLKRKLSHCEISCEASYHNFYVSFHNTYLFWSLYSIILSSLSFIKYSKQENFTDVSIVFLKYIFPQGFPRNQESWKNLFKIYIYKMGLCRGKRKVYPRNHKHKVVLLSETFPL